MKKNIGAFPALYPTPLTLVGAMVDGKPSWMTVSHVGVIGHDRILISCAKIHYTNKRYPPARRRLGQPRRRSHAA